MRRLTPAAILLSTCLAALSACGPAGAQNETVAQDFTVTLLGTGGGPFPGIERFGSSTLVEVGDQRLVFDAGRGATIRLTQLGIPLSSVTAVFLTHLHSDHVNGLSDLWLTGWLGPPPFAPPRSIPFEVYGPSGTEDMMAHLEEAFAADVRARSADGDPTRTAAAVKAYDVAQGVIYEHDGVRVSAFDVDHTITPSLGYRIDYEGHSVVLSGDTRFSKNLVEHADRADVLIHEVIAVPSEARAQIVGGLTQSERGQNALNAHTSPEDAGRVFSETGTHLAVYNHIIIAYADRQHGASELIRRTRTTYTGELEVGSDLMSIEVSDAPRVLRRGLAR